MKYELQNNNESRNNKMSVCNILGRRRPVRKIWNITTVRWRWRKHCTNSTDRWNVSSVSVHYKASFTRSLFPRRDRIFPRPCKRASRFFRRPFTRPVFLVGKLACQLLGDDLEEKSANCGHLHDEFSAARKTRRGKSDRVNAA